MIDVMKVRLFQIIVEWKRLHRDLHVIDRDVTTSNGLKITMTY